MRKVLVEYMPMKELPHNNEQSDDEIYYPSVQGRKRFDFVPTDEGIFTNWRVRTIYGAGAVLAAEVVMGVAQLNGMDLYTSLGNYRLAVDGAAFLLGYMNR